MKKRLQALKAGMLADAEVRHAYEDLAAEFDLARELIAARVRTGLTQAEVAERMGASQSAVARLEGGRRLPSMKTLLRYAEATGSRPHPQEPEGGDAACLGVDAHGSAHPRRFPCA